HLAIDPPEPGAHLHWIEGGGSGLGLRHIAAQHYDIGWGHDERLYVEALWIANLGRRGVSRNPRKQPGTAAKPGTLAHTLEVWNSVEVKPGHAIWIPSATFVEQLRSQGAISSGSPS